MALIEVLIAATLLTTALLPVIALSQRGITESGVTQEDLLGRQLVMDLCERYKTAPPAELEQVAARPELIDADGLLIPLRQAANDQPGLDFVRRVEFVRDIQGVSGLHKVTFRVHWAGRGGKVRSAELTRLIHFHDR
jgi:hypothetical protein